MIGVCRYIHIFHKFFNSFEDTLDHSFTIFVDINVLHVMCYNVYE